MTVRRWLWDAADELLIALHLPAESARVVDPVRVQSAYDQLLWEIVTSPRQALAEFAAAFYQEPYTKLPPPLLVAVWRLLGLEGGNDLQLLRAAAAGISLYCGPGEQEGAAGTIEARIRVLSGTATS